MSTGFSPIFWPFASRIGIFGGSWPMTTRAGMDA